MRNSGLKFICRMQTLRVETVRTPFTRGYAAGAVVTYALAHGEGAYMAAPEVNRRAQSSGRGRVPLLRRGGRRQPPAANPNGSLSNIAGICNDGGNVLGLMPHPENLIDALTGGTDGRAMFAGLAA